MWILPLYLHLNKKSDNDDDDDARYLSGCSVGMLSSGPGFDSRWREKPSQP